MPADADFVLGVCQLSWEGDAEAQALIPKINERLDELGVPSLEDILARILGAEGDPSRP